jgi:polyhydroxybutyrate depolymerase
MTRRLGTSACFTLLHFAVLSPLAALFACGADGAEGEDGSSVTSYVGAPPTSDTAPNAGTPTAPAPTPSQSTGNTGGEVTPTPVLQPPGTPTPSAGMQTGTDIPPPVTPTPPVEPAPPATAGGPSAGCGKGSGVPTNVAVPNTIVTFPASYDGSTPVPLLFAFHGAGRTNMDMRTVDSRTVGGALENTYVMAFVKSAGNAWDLNTDYPRFEAVLDQMLEDYCIDTDHLFAMGHSSGAQFISQMLGSPQVRETRFAGVVPVSSSRSNNPAWSPVPTMLIHGLADTQRPNDANGAIDITQYTESNQCTGGTQAMNVPACTSIADNSQVTPGCVQYTGCATPTLFCNHNDPNYIDNGTPSNHGWPCFANGQILAFFESLR